MSLPLLLGDDLSGTLEAAAAYHAHGWRVTVPLQPTAWPARTAEGEFVALNTGTRNVTPGAAAADVQATLVLAQQRGAELRFKKIDSTLRGPIAAELRAIIELINPVRVVVTPANPEAQRTVRDGVLYVAGTPVSETAFAGDPLWPVTQSDIAQLLSSGGVEEVARLPLAALRAGRDRVKAALGSARVVVADAENMDDLGRLAKVARELEPGTLFVGSAALARAVAAPPASPITLAPPPPASGAKLFVIGSRHPASHRQVARLAAARGVATIPVRPGRSAEITREATVILTTRGAVVLVAALDATDPTRLLHTFREAVRAISLGVALGTVIASGGETATAVCTALEGRSLELLREWSLGSVSARLTCVGHPVVTLVTKPGGFVDDEALVRGFDQW